MSDPYILVLYHSGYGSTKRLAYQIAQGVQESGMAVKIRTVPDVVTEVSEPKSAIPEEGDLYCTQDDLKDCAGLAMGSPTYFGNMSASLKHFLDTSVTVWMAGNLQGKPACVFTCSSGMHAGQESTLLSMMLPLMHHGMVLMGIPYSNPELEKTERGGTPYGATHVSGAGRKIDGLYEEEKALAIAQGKRLAEMATKLL